MRAYNVLGRLLAYSSNQNDRELFYLAPDRRLMSVTVQPSGAPRPSRPVEVFQTRVAGPLGIGQRFPYAVGRDGQHFLMYVSDPDAPPASFALLLNWPARLNGAR